MGSNETIFAGDDTLMAPPVLTVLRGGAQRVEYETGVGHSGLVERSLRVPVCRYVPAR